MGFHLASSPDTRYLVKTSCIIPFRFQDGKMMLHPDKPVVQSVKQHARMWVAREIGPNNTLAVGYLNLSELDIFRGTDLIRTININGSIFAIFVPPYQEMIKTPIGRSNQDPTH